MEKDEINIRISWDVSKDGKDWSVVISQEKNEIWYVVKNINAESDREGVIYFSNKVIQDE